MKPEIERNADARLAFEPLVMRDLLWRLATKNHPQGFILPMRLVLVRAVLYPLDFFYWKMSKTRGYEVESDTWIIYGVRYSSAALMALASAQGETFRITRSGDCVTIERVSA